MLTFAGRCSSLSAKKTSNWQNKDFKMGALASTDLEGYELLKERVEGSLKLLTEIRAVDFKDAAKWDEIKCSIPKDVLAMSNLRDGGIIIIGVSEKNERWELTGLTQEQLDTYNPDDMLDWVNRYASPPVIFDIVRHTHYKEPDNKKFDFLIIQAHEFEEKPIVCKRDYSGELRRGAFYIRPLGKAESREVQSADEMHDLLDLAVEKRTRNLLRQIKRIGIDLAVALEKTDADKYDEESEGF
jgi:predicted HTH transcriptional regulator